MRLAGFLKAAQRLAEVCTGRSEVTLASALASWDSSRFGSAPATRRMRSFVVAVLHHSERLQRSELVHLLAGSDARGIVVTAVGARR